MYPWYVIHPCEIPFKLANSSLLFRASILYKYVRARNFELFRFEKFVFLINSIEMQFAHLYVESIRVAKNLVIGGHCIFVLVTPGWC